MTHAKEHIAYDPDFDEKPLQEVEVAEKKTAVTMTLTFTPRKLFFAGFFVGFLVMGLPTTFFATRAYSGTDAKFAAAPSLPPSQPTQPVPQAPTPGEVKPVSKQDHVFGNANAAVTMIEYSDTECPFCKKFHPTAQQAVKEYNGKVRWVYRHFPLSFHANAQKQAEASECAAELGGNDAFWKYLNTIFERTTSGGTGFANENLVPLAKELGLNEQKFKACLDGGTYAKYVKDALLEGQKAGIDGTPGTLLLAKNGKKALIPGAVPYGELKNEIDKLLQ